MRVETLLPLGKLDPRSPRRRDAPRSRPCHRGARLVESLGYDGLAVEETKVDPYVVMALAGAGTTRLRLTTAVAMAFPRSPTITAMSAWSIRVHAGLSRRRGGGDLCSDRAEARGALPGELVQEIRRETA
jgi:luciferase-like monooxygenase